MLVTLLLTLVLAAPPEIARPTPEDLQPSRLPSGNPDRKPPAPTEPAKPTQPSVSADLSPLIHEGVIKAPIGEVWKVFSTAEGFKAFGVAQCEMDFRVGGLIRSHYNPKGVLGDDGTIVNQIMAFEPERMIAFHIQSPPKGFPFPNAYKSTWSVATLTDLGDGTTHLRLAGMGYTPEEESQKMRQFFKSGNAWSFKTLQSHFDKSVQRDATKAAHAIDPLAPIEIETVVNAPRAEVFKTYTTSDGWKDMFSVNTRIEARPGGAWEIYFSMDPPEGSRGSEGCTVLSILPDRMLSHSWNAPPKFAHARAERTWVVVEFEDLTPTTTRVRLTHMGFTEQAAKHTDHADEWKEVRGYFANAWPKVLGALKAKWEK